MKVIIIPLIALSCLTVGILALPDGAPSLACRQQFPFHNASEPQRSTPPYELSFVQEVGGNSWLITVRSVSSSFQFKGIMIQARSAADPEEFELFGTFSRPVPTETDIKAVQCDKPDDTATHTSNINKSQIQVRWTKPATGSGTIVFR